MVIEVDKHRRDVEGSNKVREKINIETRRSTTLKQRVILVQGPC